MSLRRNGNITTSLVGKASVLTSTLPAVSALVTPANLAIGGLVLVDLGNRRISTLTAGQDFRIAQGQGTDKPLLLTPILNEARITKTVGAHRSAKQQVTTVGYDPVSGLGALPTANDTSYYIKIRKRDNDQANQSQPSSISALYKTDATGTDVELAFGLAANGEKNFADEPGNGYLKFEVVTSAAGSATGAAADTVIGTAGTRTLTLTDTAANGTMFAIAVGDLIRIGTATSAEVFKVTATTVTSTAGGVLTLDRPLKADVSLLGTTAYFITAAAALAASMGVRITGKENVFSVNKWRNYYSNRFSVSFSDPTILVTKVTGAFDGVGVWQKVAMDEYMTYGFEGQNEMMGVPATPRFAFTQSAATDGATNTNKYSAYQIAWTESVSDLVSTFNAKGSVIIYLNLDQTTLGVIPASTTQNALVVALGGTVSDFDQIS